MIERERNRPAFVCGLYFILVSQQSSARGCWPLVMFYLGSWQVIWVAGNLFILFKLKFYFWIVIRFLPPSSLNLVTQTFTFTHN